MAKNQLQTDRASIAWPILIDFANRSTIMTYGELANKMGIHPRVCKYFLGLIQDHCIENRLPPLQSIVVDKKTGAPGKGYYATPTNNILNVHRSVFAFDWSKISNPFE